MSRYYDALREAGLSAQIEPTAAARPEPLARAATAAGAPPEEEVLPLSKPLPAPPAAAAPTESTRSASLQFSPLMRVLPNATKAVVTEQYRKLRTKILQLRSDVPFRTIAVTSAGAREGKTVTAANLAITFSMLPNFRVLLVDADIRRGTLSAQTNTAEQPGISNLLEGTARFEDIVFKYSEPRMDVLARGHSTLPPAELFQVSALKRHLAMLGEMYDLVIVDTAPVNFVSEARLIVGNCDAAILVARAFSTTRKALARALTEMGSARVIATVLNSGSRDQIYRKYEGYY